MDSARSYKASRTGYNRFVLKDYVQGGMNTGTGVAGQQLGMGNMKGQTAQGGSIHSGWNLRPIIYWFNVYYDLPMDLNENAEYLFESTNKEVVEVTADGELIYNGVGAAVIMVYEKNTRLKTMLEVEVIP